MFPALVQEAEPLRVLPLARDTLQLYCKVILDLLVLRAVINIRDSPTSTITVGFEAYLLAGDLTALLARCVGFLFLVFLG